MYDPACPPIIAPPTEPAICPSCSHGFCAFDAFAVPWRSSTCDSSWAITPTTSASTAAASNMPRLTNIGPPGSAKALISFRFTGVNEYSYCGSFSSAGAAATRRSPSEARYFLIRSSSMIGYCLRTSAAASRPSSTSCLGVYLFFGGFTTVCAPSAVIDAQTIAASVTEPADRVRGAIASSSGRRLLQRAGQQAADVRATRLGHERGQHGNRLAHQFRLESELGECGRGAGESGGGSREGRECAGRADDTASAARGRRGPEQRRHARDGARDLRKVGGRQFRFRHAEERAGRAGRLLGGRAEFFRQRADQFRAGLGGGRRRAGGPGLGPRGEPGGQPHGEQDSAGEC